MAAAPMPQPTSPPQATGSGNQPPGGPAVLQLVILITQASKQLAQAFPAAAPMVQEIQNQLGLAQQKMAETMAPTQPAAPPV